MKEKIVAFDDLFKNGFISERLTLDETSDRTRNELNTISEYEQNEWNEYKVPRVMVFQTK